MPLEDLKERTKAIDMAVGQIEKQFGKGAILTMSEAGVDREVESFSSGSPSIDLALGIGGYPRGRVVEIYGPESSGKTTLALHAVAEIQKLGGVAAFIDAEHALDVNYARKLGVRIEELLVSQPDTGEQALEIADVLVAHLALDLGLRHQRRHRVHDDDVHAVGAHQHLDDLQRLLAVVGLRHQQVVEINPELLGICGVERVLGVHEGRHAARLVRLGNDLQRQRRLA